MHIPYTTDARPDTGLTNPKLGIWLFLASEVMLFASLFASYVLLRVGAESWPDQSAVLSVPLALLNTVVLISSSVTMVLAWVAAKAGSLGRFRLYMGLTLLGGALFLIVKAFEYGDKFSHELLPSTNNFLGLYFTMTGLHAFHVIAGMVVNAFFWGPGVRMWHTDRARFVNRIEIAGIYWHFVDLVWIFLFPVLYLLQVGPVGWGMEHARGYLIVFAVLLILTALTVVVSSLSLTGPLAIALGVSIATAKAALVAMFFMHLKYERIIVYTTLAFTAVFCAALFGLTLWTEADHAPGTTFTQPFDLEAR